MNPTKTKALTSSALCATLGIALLALSTILPAQRLALLCLSSLGVIAALCRNGKKWALCTYGITAVLSLLLLPERSIALAYALFCGYYPVAKLKIEAVKAPLGRIMGKLLCFNLAVSLFYVLSQLLTALPLWLLFLCANGAFLLYDYALGKLIILFSRKIAGRINHG